MIELKNVTKTYKSKKGSNTTALKDVSFSLPNKGLVFILGKSGSGKSTLLNIIAGLDDVTSGEVLINGKSTAKFKEKEFDDYRNTYTGFIFQEYNLLDSYSIEQNIKLSLELQHKKADEDKIKEVLEKVGLSDVRKRKTNELSGGQKQRIAIARALIKEPEVILADEPTGNLDSETSKQIFELLKEISKEKLVIVVSHDQESAQTYADEIINIKDGEVTYKNSKRKNTEKESDINLVTAKLPLLYSFKMGVCNLFHKPFRLFFTSVLIIFSLICFGIMVSAYVSNLKQKTLELFKENGPTRVFIEKHKTKTTFAEELKDAMDSLTNYSEDQDIIYMENEEQEIIDEELLKEVENNTKQEWNMLYTLTTEDEELSLPYADTLTDEESLPVYYYVSTYALSPLTFSKEDVSKFNNLIGSSPVNDNDVVIPSYIADMIIYRGVKTEDEEKYKPDSYEKIINDKKIITFDNNINLCVTGIIDYSESLNKYSKLKETKMSEYYYQINDAELMNSYDKLFEEISTYYSTLYINSSFVDKVNSEKNTASDRITRQIFRDTKLFARKIGYIDGETSVYTNEGIVKIKELKDDEIIIDEGMLNIFTNNSYYELYESNQKKYSDKEKYIKDFLKENNIIGEYVKTNVNNNQIVRDESLYKEYKIVGVKPSEEYMNMAIYYSDSVSNQLIGKKLEAYSLYRDVEKIEELEKIIDEYPIEDAYVTSSCNYSNAAGAAAIISYLFQYISKYGVIFFLIFASFILMSFINASITMRKKEVGILRALGCRSIDIIKMFIYESLMLMIFALVVSFITIPMLTNAINNFINNQIFIDIDALKFSSTEMVKISLLMIAIVVIANLIPVRRITKMKPVDAIANK